jgi:hypothetical protein
MMKTSENIQDKRSYADRRKFTYTAHVPERRSGMDRRANDDNKSDMMVA